MSGDVKKLAPFLTAFACAAAISTGAVFCIVTAFDVPAEGWTLALCLIALSAVFSFLCGRRRGWIGLLALTLAAVGAGYYFRLTLYCSASVAIETISSVYASAFESLQTVRLMQEESGATATVFFVMIGALLSLIAAWTVRGQNTLWLAAVCGVLPLVGCLIILQSIPAAWAVLLLIGALLLLLLTQQQRKRSEREGGALALALMLPLAILMLCLYALFPQSGYERSAWSESLRPKVNQIADKLTVFRANEATGQVQFVSPFAPSTLGSRVWDSSVSKANLGRVGPQRLTGRHVMRVYSQFEKTYYLRGCSLGVYQDNQWLAVADSDYASVQIPQDVLLFGGAYEQQQVQIETDMKSSVYYTPFALTELPESAEPIYDAYIKNPLQQTQYTLGWGSEIWQAEQNAALNEAYREFVYETYTQLPEELDAFLSETYGDEPSVPYSSAEAARLAVVLYVIELVQQGKAYDLNTPRVPDDEDFAAWFLSESDTGYCVHFATAAAVLLRHFGVPARYVTGYMVQAAAGEWTDVTQDEAHAWVEYYTDDFGWRMFDPTPATAQADEDETTAAAGTTNNTDLDSAAPPTADTPDGETENSEQINAETSNKTENFDENSADSEQNEPQPTEGEKQQPAAWLMILVWCVLGLAAILFGWRIIVLSARTANFTRGSTNRRVVHYYRHIAMLSKLAKQDVPEELERLAQKARFSQHKLSDGELQQFAAYADTLTAEVLQQAAPARRAIYRMFYVLR